MNCFRRRWAGRLAFVFAAGLLASHLTGCAEDAQAAEPVAVHVQPALGDLLGDAAEQCGLDINCEAGGLAEGRASISGVASIDAFFAAVINFETKANATVAGIEAELAAIRGDFGLEADADIGASIMAQANTHFEAGLEVVAEPAKCQVSAQATVEASARCEGSATPPMAMVECRGSCEVEASANIDCGADVDVSCSFQGPAVECSGSCTGTCTVEGSAAADCSGTCSGSCDGTCSLMNAQGECQGKCDGTCEGSCDIEMKAAASCEGSCSGECTMQNPSGGCEGAASARCEGSADAMIMCEGRCDGEVTPPMVSAECEASAKAEASFNAECTPPSVQVRYELKAGADVDVEAQAKFEAGVRKLEVRLPKLLAAIKGGEVAIQAAASLGGAADGAIMGAITELQGDADIKTGVGLTCAIGELGAVAGVIGGATTKLEGSLSATTELTGALDIL